MASERSKCMPILLYAVEACPLLARQTLSFEFTLTRIFMKLFSVKSQILFRAASFLQKFTVSENSLCMLFASDARRQLHNIFIQFGDNIQTARQLRNAFFLLNSLISYSCC